MPKHKPGDANRPTPELVALAEQLSAAAAVERSAVNPHNARSLTYFAGISLTTDAARRIIERLKTANAELTAEPTTAAAQR